MNTTPAQKKAHAEFERRLKEAGGSKITLRLDPEPTKRLAEITAALGSRDKAIAAAIMAFRLAPPVQDTKAGPVADYDARPARRAKGPERSKTLPPTLPAGDPVKAATKAPERAGVGGKFKGVTATGEELPERPPMQKSGPKGARK